MPPVVGGWSKFLPIDETLSFFRNFRFKPLSLLNYYKNAYYFAPTDLDNSIVELHGLSEGGKL